MSRTVRSLALLCAFALAGCQSRFLADDEVFVKGIGYMPLAQAIQMRHAARAPDLLIEAPAQLWAATPREPKGSDMAGLSRTAHPEASR